MLYDHIPDALRAEIYDWLRANAAEERKPKDTDEQFFYKTRKKALGPFKQKLWSLGPDVAAALDRAYDEKFKFLFTQLAVGETAEAVGRYVSAAPVHRPAPGTPGHGAVAHATDDADAGE
jgi:hypothetical protein